MAPYHLDRIASEVRHLLVDSEYVAFEAQPSHFERGGYQRGRANRTTRIDLVDAPYNQAGFAVEAPLDTVLDHSVAAVWEEQLPAAGVRLDPRLKGAGGVNRVGSVTFVCGGVVLVEETAKTITVLHWTCCWWHHAGWFMVSALAEPEVRSSLVVVLDEIDQHPFQVSPAEDPRVWSSSRGMVSPPSFRD